MGKRGKRGGKKHKESATAKAEAAQQADDAQIISNECLKEDVVAPVLDDQPPGIYAEKPAVPQLPNLTYDTKSYFCNLEYKLDDPDSFETLEGILESV